MTLKMMPGAVAQIEWVDDRDRRLEDLVVFDRTNADARVLARYERRFPASGGASVGEWMKGNPRWTPESIFVAWARDGFVDEFVMLKALDQLGQIEEAQFARTMAAALRSMLIQERGGELDREEDARLDNPVYEAAQ